MYRYPVNYVHYIPGNKKLEFEETATTRKKNKIVLDGKLYDDGKKFLFRFTYIAKKANIYLYTLRGCFLYISTSLYNI